MFGAIGYDSDHVEENYHEEGADSNKECQLGMNVTNILKALSETPKTQIVCGFCHRKIKYCIIANLPKELSRKYDPISPQAVSLYLDSSEGKNLTYDFERAWQSPNLV